MSRNAVLILLVAAFALTLGLLIARPGQAQDDPNRPEASTRYFDAGPLDNESTPQWWVFNSQLHLERKDVGADGVTTNTLLLNTRTGETYLLRPTPNTPTGYHWFIVERK
jgi:hypothetical protein